MKTDNSQPTPNDSPERRPRWPWILAAGCVLVLVLALLQSLLKENQPTRTISKDALQRDMTATFSRSERAHLPPRFSNSKSAATAEEIVAGKVNQFGKSRRKLAHALAKHFKVGVPDDVERFFDAVEAGRWEEVDALFKSLRDGENPGAAGSAELRPIWRVIQETWGVAREAHNWPAQKLLDYGEVVLGSLRPGMVYVGGTDPGCFIATMLNDTSEGERHITFTQNALADGSYLDYLNFLYGDRLSMLTPEDSQHAFQDYLSDAQKRLQHDQQFPNEPKHIRPGEDVRMTDGKFQISGEVAVMAINEKLFQMLMDKNPDATFAIEQSFPFESMYPTTVPLGPIMELRVPDSQSVFTAERAAQSVDYWRTTAQQLLSDPTTPDGSDPRKAYSKLLSEQAALFLDRKYTAEAEQAFQIAIQLAPSSPEAVSRYTNLLIGQKRFDEALPVVESALKLAPDNKQFRDLLMQLNKAKKN